MYYYCGEYVPLGKLTTTEIPHLIFYTKRKITRNDIVNIMSNIGVVHLDHVKGATANLTYAWYISSWYLSIKNNIFSEPLQFHTIFKNVG